MWQLINHSLSIPEDKTKWTLIYSNVSEADICMSIYLILAVSTVNANNSVEKGV